MPARYKLIISVVFLVIITAIVFSPSLKNGFVNCDDNVLLTENPYIRSFSAYNLENIFTRPYFGLYHPLVQLSYAVEYKFFGLNPFVYHLDNLLLHILNVLLAFWMIFLLTRSVFSAFVTALLFAIHPMHVESVAWISERKDLLYALFYLSSIVFYIKYFKDAKSKFYVLSLFLFLMSLLSKTMAVSLPLALIAVDYFMKREDYKKILFEKAPYLALSVIFGIIALSVHYSGEGVQAARSILLNLKFAIFGLVFYIQKLLLPLDLSFSYPFIPESMKGISLISTVPIAAVSLIVAAIIYSAKYTRVASFGFLFYLAAILPVIQLIPIGQNTPSDRYTYIPFIGLFFIAAEGFKYLRGREKTRLLSGTVLFAVITLFSLSTLERVKVWHDSYSLWTDVLKKYPDSARGLKGMGDTYKEAGDNKKAIEAYTLAQKSRPGYADVYNNRGTLYSNLGRYQLAERDFSEAIKLNPRSPGYFYNRGLLYEKMKLQNPAISDYSESIRLDPRNAQAHNNRGVVFARLGKYDQAIKDFQTALKIDPTLSAAEKNLSSARSLIKNRTK